MNKPTLVFIFALAIGGAVSNAHTAACQNLFHESEVDVPIGIFTKAELAVLASHRPNSKLSSKTPPVALDGLHDADILTIVVDFKDTTQPVTSDVFGNMVGPIDLTEFGFNSNEFESVFDAMLAEVFDDFFDELAGTVANENSMNLQVNFVAGNIGTPPPGISEYYFVQVGSGLSGPHVGALGVASGSSVRNSGGSGPNNGIEIGDVVSSVFTDNIQNIGNLTPSNALSSGNVFFTRNAIVGTLSHEIGHTLSLSHANFSQSVQPTQGAAPIMGTGAIDLPNQQRITDREFSLSAFNAQNGNAEVFHIQQLTNSVGLGISFEGPLTNQSININAGIASGGLANLMSNDDSKLELVVGELPPSGAPPIDFEITAISPILNPDTLSLRIESQGNSFNVIQRLDVFNSLTQEFELVDERDLTTDSNSSFDVDLTTDASNYIDPKACQIRCRVSFFADGPVLLFPWKVEIDQLMFRINE